MCPLNYITAMAAWAPLLAQVLAPVYTKHAKEAFPQAKPLTVIEPTKQKEYKAMYEEWKELLEQCAKVKSNSIT